MGFPEINNNIDQTSRNVEVNSYPLSSQDMALKNFNEMFGLTQSKDQIAFLPSGDDLLSQFPNQTPSKFASRHDKFSNQQGQTTDLAPKTTDQALKSTDQSVKLPSDAGERSAQKRPRSEAINKKYGTLEYGYNKQGEHISITGPRGEYFYKGTNGKWVEHMPPNRERTVENFKFDKEGNMEFDVVGKNSISHHKRNADGSHSIDSPEHGGKLVYDKNGNLTEAPSGDGHPPRKFHYDKDGKLDQIDGRLGHWDREVKDGKVTWVNKKSGARWEGEMSVNPKTNELEFRGRNGANWNFTTTGKDIPVYSR